MKMRNPHTLNLLKILWGAGKMNYSTACSCQGTPFSKQARNLKFKWLEVDSNPEPRSSYTNIQSVWPNGWVFIYKLTRPGFEFSCSHLTSRFRTCFEQGVPWHSGNYRAWIEASLAKWLSVRLRTCNFTDVT